MKIRKLLIVFLLFVTAASCFSCERAESTGGAESTVNAADTQTTPTTETESVHETEVQTEPAAETEPAMPDESYIGSWFMDESKDLTFRITKIEPGSISFTAEPAEEMPFFHADATIQDGEFVFCIELTSYYYGKLYENRDSLTGKLEFENNSIIITYDNFDPKDPEKITSENTVYKYIYKNELDVIDWPSNDVPQEFVPAIQEAIDELTSKGWKDIEVIPHEPDSLKRWGILVTPYELNEGEILYSVTGRTSTLYSVVNIVLKNNAPSAERVEVYYCNMGRLLDDEYLKSFLGSESEMLNIIHADDEELYYYMFVSY